MTEERPELRYTDGPGVEADVLIDATPADVWALVSDIQLPARFGTEFLGAEFLDGATAPAAGARFTGRNHHPAAGEWQTVCTIDEFVPERVFGYVVDGIDGPSSHWRFTLSAEPSGTRVTQAMCMGPARSFINVAIDSMPDKETRILRRRLGEHRTNMEANLRGIKDLLES